MPQLDLTSTALPIVLATTIPFVIVAIFLLIWAMRGRAQANASKSWEMTTGRVLMSQVEMRYSGGRNRMTPYPSVVYEYTVNGQRFQGNRISFGTPIGGTMIAAPTVNRYPVGSDVTVYYNPLNPVEAVLERKSSSSQVLIWVVVLIVGILACTTIATLGGMSIIGRMVNDITSQIPTR